LSSQGHKVRSAQNGIDGLKKLKEEKPDIVLLDIFMPLMDGREFLRNFNAAEYPLTKIFVLSNVSNKETEQEVLANGAKLFLLKAELSPLDLVRVVEEAA
ncbi:MAG TPA: response regulator, partial [Candidatus Dormibacteraeota bacterium]|nr:response regulator [Candidatus Dormibacteraeota bacterium]